MHTITFQETNISYETNEEMKQFRANLQFCGEDKKVILVTSSTENEGKSMISLELACSLAELGKRILLVDADMRKSVLRDRTIDVPRGMSGLSHYLSGQATLDDVLCFSEAKKLHVIFAGRVPPNPAELLAGAKMKKFLESVRERFDYVIVDCPPIGMVADAAMVAPCCDGCIFVLHDSFVPRKVAQGAVKAIERTGCPMIGVVLNQMNVRRKGKYYYNKYYRYYKKGYGYYKKDNE